MSTAVVFRGDVRGTLKLMHQPVSAILEAKRFQLSRALFLVHAFGDNDSSLEDYRVWAKQLGVDAAAETLRTFLAAQGVRHSACTS